MQNESKAAMTQHPVTPQEAREALGAICDSEAILYIFPETIDTLRAFIAQQSPAAQPDQKEVMLSESATVNSGHGAATATTGGAHLTNAQDCDWPEGARFTMRDEPGEHDPCWLILPDGAMVSFHHHARNGVDQARVKFIMDACNAALSAGRAQEK